MFVVTDGGCNLQERNDSNVDWANHALLCSQLLSRAAHAQCVDLKDIVVSVNGGGGAEQCAKLLVGYFGAAALSIKDNPALRHITVVVEGAGNDWCYEDKRGKAAFYTIDTLPEETKLYYRQVVKYAQAIGGSAWIGIGSAEVYSGKQNGDYFDRYNQMVVDLRTMVQGFGVVLTNERAMLHLDKRDTTHCACTMRSTRIWTEIIQDAYELCKLIRRVEDIHNVFEGINMQNPYARICVDFVREGHSSLNHTSGKIIEWSSNAFKGKWTEPLMTAAAEQPEMKDMSISDMDSATWMNWERNR